MMTRKVGNGSSFLHIGFLAFLTAGCDRAATEATEPKTTKQAVATTLDVLGFETLEGWSASAGTVALDDRRTQGLKSLAISGIGYAEINSIRLGTLEDPASPVLVDLLLPVEQPDPSWLGSLQLLIDLPAQGLYNAFVAQKELTGLTLDVFHTLEFPLTADMVAKLGQPYDDLQLRLVLNVPSGNGKYLFDNIRFGAAEPPPTDGGGGSGGAAGAGGAAGSGGTAGAGGFGGVGTGEVSGTYNGESVPALQAVAIRRTEGFEQVSVVLTSIADPCAEILAGRDLPDEWVVGLTVLRQDVPITTGVFPIGQCGDQCLALGQIARDNATCENALPEEHADGGEIRLDALTSSRITGTYSVQFPGDFGTLSGSFDAPFCQLPANQEDVTCGG